MPRRIWVLTAGAVKLTGNLKLEPLTHAPCRSETSYDSTRSRILHWRLAKSFQRYGPAEQRYNPQYYGE